jgi:hypothetical protein
VPLALVRRAVARRGSRDAASHIGGERAAALVCPVARDRRVRARARRGGGGSAVARLRRPARPWCQQMGRQRGRSCRGCNAVRP